MNLTLHLTENCNMNCTYCVYEKTSQHMSREVLHKAPYIRIYRGDALAALYNYNSGSDCYKCFKYLQ